MGTMKVVKPWNKQSRHETNQDFMVQEVSGDRGEATGIDGSNPEVPTWMISIPLKPSKVNQRDSSGFFGQLIRWVQQQKNMG